MKFLVFSLALIVSVCSFAFNNKPYSAKRLPNESYKEKAEQFKKHLNIWSSPYSRFSSAQDASVKFDKLDEKSVKNWNGSVDFETFFKNVRDDRFLKKTPTFPRRLTWLYPDDGCYARAEISSQKSRDYDFSGGSKIFAFGDLTVKTNNTPEGSVSWWYHVATAYRLNGTVYVIDPAIEPDQPMRLESWLSSMGDIHQLEVSICDSSAYEPSSTCYPKNSSPTDKAFYEIEEFLNLEWQRLVDLGRVPDKELGEEPPWKKSF